MSRKLLFLALATTMALSVNAQKDATIPPVIQQLIDNMVLVEGGTFYVFRGGSWVNEPWYARVSMRNGNQPRVRSVNLGLRLSL